MSALSYFSLILLLLLLTISIKVRGVKPLVSLITLGLVMYIGLRFNLRNVLFVSMANFALLIGALLLNVHRNVFGLSEMDIKNRGGLVSIPYLVVIATVSFFQCALCYSLILLWLVLWYYFKNKCGNLNRRCMMFLYIPTVILALVYKTPMALSYAIITHWFQGEIESINEKNIKEYLIGQDSVRGALDDIPRDAWDWKRDG